MGRSSSNVGAALAIVAGLIALGTTTWPIRGPESGYAGNYWGMATHFLGALFLPAPLIAQRSTALAKAILGIGGLLLIVSGIVFGILTGDLTVAVIDFLCAALALAAAALVGPRVREDVERARAAESMRSRPYAQDTQRRRAA